MTLHKERRIGRLSVLLLLNEAEESTQVEEPGARRMEGLSWQGRINGRA